MRSLSVDVTDPRSTPRAVAENDFLPPEEKISSKRLFTTHKMAPSWMVTPFMIGTLNSLFKAGVFFGTGRVVVLVVVKMWT